MILEEETFKKFGYYPSDLLPKSGKPILAKCDKCGRVRVLRKDAYSPRCFFCAHAKSYRHPTQNRMYQFERLYSGFLSDHTPPWETVVDEIKKKALQANPYALNIWSFFDKDFSYSSKVQAAITVYYHDILPHRRTKKAR